MRRTFILLFTDRYGETVAEREFIGQTVQSVRDFARTALHDGCVKGATRARIICI